MNTRPLTDREIRRIADVMGDRRFVLLHFGPDGQGYYNSHLSLKDGTTLVEKSLEALRKARATDIGYNDAEA